MSSSSVGSSSIRAGHGRCRRDSSRGSRCRGPGRSTTGTAAGGGNRASARSSCSSGTIDQNTRSGPASQQPARACSRRRRRGTVSAPRWSDRGRPRVELVEAGHAVERIDLLRHLHRQSRARRPRAAAAGRDRTWLRRPGCRRRGSDPSSAASASMVGSSRTSSKTMSIITAFGLLARIALRMRAWKP